MSDHLRPDDEVVTAYTSLRSRVVDLVRAQPAEAADRPVPHCPAWTVGDLLAHMVGAPEDILAVTVALGFVLHTADEASPGLAGQLLSSGIDDFDLLRACSGRRSREQIAALGLDPDLAATMVAGSPVSLPSAPVDE